MVAGRRRLGGSNQMTVSMGLEDIRAHWDLLQHLFYTRWKAGELSRDELADYACQYAHVVRGIPGWLESAGEDLRGHAVEEASHVALWERFGEALGMAAGELRGAPANEATVAL